VSGAARADRSRRLHDWLTLGMPLATPEDSAPAHAPGRPRGAVSQWYLLRTADDELTDRLAARGAERFADLLRRLGE
jgi:hypothetical protein